MSKKNIKIGIYCLLFSIIFLFSGCIHKVNIAKIAKTLSTYDIQLEYKEDHSVTATQTVTYKNNTGTMLNDIKFHLYATAFSEGATNRPVSTLTESSAYPNGVNYGTYTITKISYNNTEKEAVYEKSDNDILVVNDIELKNKKEASIYFEYNFTLPNVNHRYGYGENTINLANFYPIVCVYDNGWDTSSYNSNGDPFYSDTANYNVTISYPMAYTLAHSGYEVSTTANSENTLKTTLAQAKVVRDFALVLSDKFEVKQDYVNDILIKYFYYDNENPEYSLNTACLAISTYSNLFGNYPYKTYNVVETNFVHGGMEYPNLVYISDAVDAVADYQNVIIHETAHQWWYGVVGNSAYHYGWLDEGLTEYSTLLFYENNPTYNVKIEDSIKASTNSYVLFVDIYTQYLETLDTSMDRDISQYDTEPEYVYMAYVKGMLLFDNLRETIGDKKFFSGLQKYFSENMFTNVTPTILIDTFSKVSGSNLKPFFDSWITGKVVIQSI